ncbi:MAG: FAD-dependent oxidoreductase [Lentisphaerae bacterium]|nr:FAD-dependent oxidoreductase [Lentisphaerota bacterium]
MASISYQKTIPIRCETEILIAGGGPSGIAAALAAAGQGRKVLLLEAQSCLGGLGTAGLVPGFVTFGDGENFLSDGIGRLILDSLSREKGPSYPGSLYSIPVELLKRVYDRLLLQAGVEFIFQTQVVDVILCGDRIDMAVCQAKSGFFAVKADQFIDCTGDGDVSVWAGAPFEKGDASGNAMPGTLCSLWAGVNFDGRDPNIDFMSVLKKSFADGVFTVPDHHHSGMTRVGKTLSGGNF